MCLLQYVTDAILSGEVVRAGDVLDVARRTDMVKSKQVPPPPPCQRLHALHSSAVGRPPPPAWLQSALPSSPSCRQCL